MSIKLSTTDSRFSIVRPVLSAPRLEHIWMAEGVEDFHAYVKDIPSDEVAVALDIETRGTVPSHPDFRIVGVGLSCSIGSIYLDSSEMTEEDLHSALIPIITLPLIGHNIYFDAAGLQRIGHSYWNVSWKACTYVLYKQIASEGFPQQMWGLKSAMKDMLGWGETNEALRDEWLVANGYVTDMSKLSTCDTAEKRLARYNERDKNGSRKLKPQLSEMWRVPASILGPYCALDCDATWQLYMQVLLPALATVPPQTAHMHQANLIEIGILIDNHFSGMTVDAEALSLYNEELKLSIVSKKKDFLEGPVMAPLVKELQEKWIAEIVPPAQFKKDGKPSKTYENYLTKIKTIREGTDEKLNKQFGFNINGNEMREVLYTKLVQYEVIQEHQGPDAPGKIRLTGGEGIRVGVELFMTDSGSLPVDAEAFGQMGSIGAALKGISETEKLQSYVEAGLLKTGECGDGVAHPQYRAFGTLTGRLSGGGDSEFKVNYQQLPGDERYLSCYKARPGYVLVQADFSSIEPTVLAEISRDKTYMELYGPNAKAHDTYLYIGTKIAKFKKAILDSGYDPDNPESIEISKKVCKHERKILKKVQLGSSYGAGIFKIYSTLKLDGVDITQSEVEQIYNDYWGPELFGGIRQFQRELEKEWRDYKGWVMDALGCPAPVCEKYKKDIVNRVCQRSGHSILVIFLGMFLKPMLEESGTDYYWYIPDLHDETIYEVREDQAQLALQVHSAAVEELNAMLGGVTKIKMEPKVIASLAERKD